MVCFAALEAAVPGNAQSWKLKGEALLTESKCRDTLETLLRRCVLLLVPAPDWCEYHPPGWFHNERHVFFCAVSHSSDDRA